MAKRKTPKAQKLVDLAPERPEKIKEHQLARVQAAIKTMDQFVQALGQLELRKANIIKNVEGVQEQIDNVRDMFQKEYGTDDVNIQDGTINYPPENSNPEENGETDKEDQCR